MLYTVRWLLECAKDANVERAQLASRYSTSSTVIMDHAGTTYTEVMCHAGEARTEALAARAALRAHIAMLVACVRPDIDPCNSFTGIQDELLLKNSHVSCRGDIYCGVGCKSGVKLAPMTTPAA